MITSFISRGTHNSSCRRGCVNDHHCWPSRDTAPASVILAAAWRAGGTMTAASVFAERFSVAERQSNLHPGTIIGTAAAEGYFT